MNEPERLPIRTAGVINPVGAAQAAARAGLDERRYEYLLARRDQLLDRLRFGTLGLNGASLLALVTTIHGSNGLAWLGSNAGNDRWSAVFFAVGTILAASSVWIEANHARGLPATAFTAALGSRRLEALHSAPMTDKVHDAIMEELEDAKTRPSPDFEASHLSIWTGACAAGAWLGGIALPIGQVIGIW